MIESPRQVQRRWEKGFQEPLEQVLDSLLAPGEAETSPIMESIQSVAISTFAGRELEGRPKRLIIVSDMLQYTSGLSHYRGELDFDGFRQSPYYRQIRTGLDDVDVEILYLRRPTQAGVQGKSHVAFWQAYFADQGATLVRVFALDG